MRKPAPEPGLVIRYDFLWRREYRRGRREGAKDRPCAIVVATTSAVDGSQRVVVAITHSPPQAGTTAIELPAKVKAHLGLDAERSWIIADELNRLSWDDPGVTPAVAGVRWAYGFLPRALVIRLRQTIRALAQAERVKVLGRDAER